MWILDLGVYQKLLHANFEEAHKLERAYDLPQTHQNMGKSFKGKGVSGRLLMFYALPSSFLIPGGLFWMSKNYWNLQGAVLAGSAIGSIAVAIVIILLMRRESQTAAN